MGEQMSMPRFHAGIAADLFFLSPAAAVHLSVVGKIHESSVLSDLDLLTEVFRLRRRPNNLFFFLGERKRGEKKDRSGDCAAK